MFLELSNLIPGPDTTISTTVTAQSEAWSVLHPLKQWDRGFECHSRHGCLLFFCVSVVLCSERVDPPSKDSEWETGQGT
jgi:hypothetical protein